VKTLPDVTRRRGFGDSLTKRMELAKPERIGTSDLIREINLAIDSGIIIARFKCDGSDPI
jgi:hypothetical protein